MIESGGTQEAEALVGVAVVAVRTPPGTPMAGFAARTSPSLGVHDPVTVRALLVDDTCWITVDVCGLHEDTCDAIASQLPIRREAVAITATHTHSGPCVMPKRLGGHDAGVLQEVINAVHRAFNRASQTRRAAQLRYATCSRLGIAHNRRHSDAAVDPELQLIAFIDRTSRVMACLVLYPCHPVVLGADNLQISGDYPAFLRNRIEARIPGSVAVFLPGAAGDMNTGHSAEASYSPGPDPQRTFASARKIGEHLGETAAEEVLRTLKSSRARGSVPTASVSARRARVSLDLEVLDSQPPAMLAESWRAAAVGADDGTRALLAAWEQWAHAQRPESTRHWTGSLSVFSWLDITVVGLPGEPFLHTAQQIEAYSRGPVMVTGYTNGCPGYFPTASEYHSGGYEVVDAHRYYGMPAPFKQGSAERLVDVAARLMQPLQ